MKKDYSKRLDEFADKLKEIPEILAAFYTGSTAKQTWDEFSDVDVDIVVRDKDFDKICERVPSLLRLWGDVKFSGKYPDEPEIYAHIGEEYLKVEVGVIKESELEILTDIRVAFDKKKILKKTKTKRKIDHGRFVNDLLFLRDWHLYTAKHWGRGQRFSALKEVYGVRKELLKLFSKVKGLEDYEVVRGAEKLLSDEEREFFSSEIRNVQVAMKRNWEFMKHIEGEYEKKFKKLNLKCDDGEILRKIGEFYDNNS